jgi:hypothetical protein
MDYRLISEKLRGLNKKVARIFDSRIIF